ncbi:MAG: hypothetical protein ABI042_02525 [Verrucomicrobiota bacterium]
MKKIVLIALTILGAGIATSKADAGFSISFNNHHGHHQRAARYYSPAPIYSAPVIIEQPRVIYSEPRYSYTPSHGEYHHQLRDQQVDFDHAQRDNHQEYHHEQSDRYNHGY